MRQCCEHEENIGGSGWRAVLRTRLRRAWVWPCGPAFRSLRRQHLHNHIRSVSCFSTLESTSAFLLIVGQEVNALRLGVGIPVSVHFSSSILLCKLGRVRGARCFINHFLGLSPSPPRQPPRAMNTVDAQKGSERPGGPAQSQRSCHVAGLESDPGLSTSEHMLSTTKLHHLCSL